MASLVGCSDVDLISGSSDKDAIVFDNVQTKAVVSSADQILGMGVLAQMNLGDEDKQEAGSNSYIMILDNEHVTRTSPSAPWTYENTRYWVPDRVYHFFAVWPYSGAANSPVTNLSAVATEGAYGYSVTFNTPENADQELLTAKSTEVVAGNSFPGSVGLTFDHQLTNVHFKVWRNGAPEGEDDIVKIKQVQLSNISKKGTLLTSPDHAEADWRYWPEKMSFTKTYDNPGGNAISAAEIVDGQLVTDGNNPAVPFGADGLLLIPHTITASSPVIIKVIYDYYNEDTDSWEEKTLQAFLPEGTWPAGKRLVYNLIISGENTITQFQINSVVEDWRSHPEEIDFSQTVTCSAKMEWVPGTYEKHDDVNCKVVLFTDKSITATCRFKIDTPLEATWTASLIPLTSSAMDAFSIVEDTKYGEVGTNEWQYVKIQVNNNDPMAPMHACILRITVQTADGRTIVVRNLMPLTAATGVEEYTIIQNLING